MDGAETREEAGEGFALGSALLAAIALADLALVLGWLARPALLGNAIGWLFVRALLAGLAAAIVRRRARTVASDGRRLALATVVWCFVLPVFGAAIACVVTWAPVRPAAKEIVGAWQRFPLPVRWDDPDLKLAPPARHEAPEAVAGDLLLADRAHDGRRLHAMLRAARLPLRFQVPLARRALGDTNDDVRLYAFSLIDRRRREHERAVQAARALLDEAPTPAARARAHLRLGELAWEGAYHGLHEGAALREALETALEQVDRSLTVAAEDAPAHALRGRVLLRLGDPDAAERAFRRALALGHAAVKVLPYLAEGAFQRRRFTDVHEHLAHLRALEDVQGPMLGSLRLVLEHWL